MKVLDKLKTIFKGKFGDILSNNNITLFNFSRNTTTTLESKDNKTATINLNKATLKEKKEIKKEIIDVVVREKKDAFLIEESTKKTHQIKRNLPKDTDIEILKFYKDKLKPDMYKALENSLIVRNASKNSEDITELKRDIARKYPEFGNNLCNLTGRDYFHGHFKDLYLSMLEDEDFDILDYQRKVEKIVKSLPYIVFITRYKSYDELGGIVKFKLEKLKKYGTGRLLLHGLGRANVSTTLTILEEYEDDDNIAIEKDINPQKTIISATLKF